MKIRYYAKLEGDIQIEEYIRFEAADIEAAQEFADSQAEDHYLSYGEAFDEDDLPLFSAAVEIYDPEKHDELFTDVLEAGEWEIII